MSAAFRESIFFPNAVSRNRYRRSVGGSLLLGVAAALGTNLFPDKGKSLIVLLTFAGMTYVFLLLELWIIEKFMVRRANRLLESLNALVKKPDYIPVKVTVQKPNFNQSFAYLLNGRCVRKAKAEDGKVYLVEYNHKTDQEFKAKLYQIPSGWLFKGTKNVVVPSST